MFECPAFLLPTNLGQPMHSPLALTEHVSLNLAGSFLLDPVEMSTNLETPCILNLRHFLSVTYTTLVRKQ